MNHKRVYWLYREEGLAVRRKRRHNRVAGTTRVPLRLPTRANQVWTMGFAQYTLASERKFRTLNLMDIYGWTRGDIVTPSTDGVPGIPNFHRIPTQHKFHP